MHVERFRVCKLCGKRLHIADFPLAPRYAGGRYPLCSYCAAKRVRECRLANGTYTGKRRPKLRIATRDGFHICIHCEKPQSIDMFRFGVGWCRKCRTDLEAERRRKKGIKERKKYVEKPGKKQCRHCLRLRSVTCFSPAIRGAMGLSAYCKDCANKYHRATPGKSRQYTKTYRTRHRGRSLMLHRSHQQKRRAKCGENIPAADLKKLYDTRICHYCEEYVPRKLRTADHVVSLHRGGRHHISNMVMACRTCNSKKRITSAAKFKQSITKKEK
jgi:hypothetical protein